MESNMRRKKNFDLIFYCQIFLDDRRSYQLGSFYIVQHSFPVLDIQVHKQNVYVMTENTVRMCTIYEHWSTNIISFEVTFNKSLQLHNNKTSKSQ